MKFVDIRRNNLPDAQAYYRAQGRRIPGEIWRVLWHMQDDPSEFERLSRRWHVY